MKTEEFMFRALVLLGALDAAPLERDEPEVFAAFQRRLRAQRNRATGDATGTASPSGASSSGSSGGSTSSSKH